MSDMMLKTKAEVTDNDRTMVWRIKERKGCILITCFSSNISRIKSILSISKKINKKVLVIGRSLNRSIDAAKEVGLLDYDVPIISIKDVTSNLVKKLLIGKAL